MIKLLLIISSYEINGVSSIAKNLLNSLDRNKFKIVFVTEKIQERHYSIPADVCVRNLNIEPKHSIFKKIINMLRHIINFRNLVVAENPDLIFSLDYATSCYLLFKPIKQLKQKIIIAEFSENLFRKPIRYNMKYLISRATYKTLIFFTYGRATRIVVVSQSIARHIKNLFNLDKNKIKVIHTSVNLADIRSKIDEPILDYIFQKDILYISTLSRLSPEKGIDYLLRAFAQLRQRVKSKLIIIGEGESRYCLETMAKSLRIDEDVSFLGYKDNPFKYLKQTDIFVLSSIREGFPNVILESYACEVPVVATRCVAGIEELIADSESGILVNPADVNSLYRAMIDLYFNFELREKLKNAGLKKVKDFDITLKSKEYQDLLLDTYAKASIN